MTTKEDIEFSGGPDLAIGSLRGTRAFDVDKLGRLTGVSFKDVWTPGENVAKCHRAEVDIRAQFNTLYGFGSLFGMSSREDQMNEYINKRLTGTFLGLPVDKVPAFSQAIEDKKEADARRKAEDRLPDCTHGFYGYYEGSNDYRQKGRINAVIEAYGEVVIGTRGFRAMKAKILAIHIPKKFDANLARLVVRNYPDVYLASSFNQMVSEFPLDNGEIEPSPTNDADFWTRKV